MPAVGRERAPRRPGRAPAHVGVDDRLLARPRPARPGRRRCPNGSSAHARSSAVGRPRSAGGAQLTPSTRWMHSRSAPSAAAERRQDQRQARGRVGRGKAVGEAVQPAELAAGRGVGLLPGDQRDDVVGVGLGGVHVGDDAGRDAARRCGRPAGTSARRRGRPAAPWCPARARLSVSCSTCADSLTPSDAVGSSRISSRGWSHIARATASSWRWPPESVLTARVVSWQRDAEAPRAAPRPRRGSAVSERSRPRALVAEQQVRRDVEVVAQREVLPDDRDAAAGHGRRVGRRAARRRSGCGRSVGAMSPAMQRTSVDLPAPFSPASATVSPARISRSSRRARGTSRSEPSAPPRSAAARRDRSRGSGPRPRSHCPRSPGPAVAAPGAAGRLAAA